MVRITRIPNRTKLLVGDCRLFSAPKLVASPYTMKGRARSDIQEERTQRLCEWEKAPGARYCHPREEHLLPLHVCIGLAGRACDELFELTILNKKSSMYLWHPS